MKKLILAVAFVACAAVSAAAQVGAPSSKLVWDQSAPDLATAQGYTYRYYPDGATTGQAFVGTVACAGTTSPFVCQVVFPAFTPGPHSLAVTTSNLAGESAKSAVLSFTFVVIPTAPANLRIQ